LRLVGLLLLTVAVPALAMETVVYKKDGKTVQLVGRVTVRSQAGQILLQTRDGQYHLLEKSDDVSATSDETPFAPFSAKELAESLKDEFTPLGREFSTEFRLLPTKHYLIVYNTSQQYAQWIGNVFETLLASYSATLKQNGFPIEKNEFPLVVVLLSNRKLFEAYARKDISSVSAQGVLAYYHKWTNRVVIYDQTGIERRWEGVTGRLTKQEIDSILARPGARENLSSALHEAVHQIGFNCGIHHRFSPCPLWVCEGLALLFESPSIAAGTGKSAGVLVNRDRYRDLARFMQKKTEDPIQKLIMSDDPLAIGTVESVRDAYALTWGIAYFLNTRLPKQWVAYLKCMGEKKPYEPYPPEERLADFETHFGKNWPQFYKEMEKFYEKLK